MTDYKSMYYELFHEMNDTIERFKNTLLEAEEIYIQEEKEKSSILHMFDL